MTGLHTVPTSKASTEQRAGRAGRLGPGTVIRLWSKAEHAARTPAAPPSIAEDDLAPVDPLGFTRTVSLNSLKADL